MQEAITREFFQPNHLVHFDHEPLADLAREIQTCAAEAANHVRATVASHGNLTEHDLREILSLASTLQTVAEPLRAERMERFYSHAARSVCLSYMDHLEPKLKEGLIRNTISTRETIFKAFGFVENGTVSVRGYFSRFANVTSLVESPEIVLAKAALIEMCGHLQSLSTVWSAHEASTRMPKTTDFIQENLPPQFTDRQGNVPQAYRAHQDLMRHRLSLIAESQAATL